MGWGYDNDFHLDQGYETFEDWLYDHEHSYFENNDYENKKINRSYKNGLNKIELKKCTNINCSGKMVVKLNSKNNTLFWGCTAFPV